MTAGPGALKEVASLFLRLGSTAFGGPAAHIAMMEDEVVRRRRWLSREQLLDLLGATNLIPGELDRDVHVGWRDHLKVGVPVTVLTLALDLTLLGLLE